MRLRRKRLWDFKSQKRASLSDSFSFATAGEVHFVLTPLSVLFCYKKEKESSSWGAEDSSGGQNDLLSFASGAKLLDLHPTSIQLRPLKSDRGPLCRTQWTWRGWAAEWWRWRCTLTGWTRGCPASRRDTCRRWSAATPWRSYRCPSWTSRASGGTGTAAGGCRSRGPGWGWRRLSWWQPGLRRCRFSSSGGGQRLGSTRQKKRSWDWCSVWCSGLSCDETRCRVTLAEGEWRSSVCGGPGKK